VKKILSIVGARPQFIKAAMLSRAWAAAGAEEALVHTGQHYDAAMSDVFFAEMDLPEPKHHLGIGSASHGAQTGRMLEQLEQVILAEKPDWVVVYGDTNSTLAGALAAAKLHVPVAHVEAGLRSFNRAMPEELNRLVADQLSDLRFAPTDEAVAHLKREGFAAETIHQVGDVMHDAVQHFGARTVAKPLNERLGVEGPFALATIHRAENTDDPARLKTIITGLEAVHTQLPVVFPVHPRTRKALSESSLQPALHLGEPVGYVEMLQLEKSAAVVVTDSGGIQKEAFFQGTPCVTARTETEWVELVEHGWNRLADPNDPVSIPQAVEAALSADLPAAPPNLYGGGHAAEAMVDILLAAPQAH
tara:strand:+ start:560 stop:1642 length:1083 start_codon:yes stop_codon:yes gene_type:complete